jgi:ApeA N-terminal domain 1/Apea-like HEPN
VAFQEDGVTLNLEGALHAPGPGGSGGGPVVATEPVIHGCLRDGRQVTLYQASGLTWPFEGVQETWQAEFLLTGGLVPGDRFVQAQIVFDYLTPWVQPASIVTGAIGGDHVVIDTRRVTVDEAILADKTKVRLCAGVEGQSGHASVHLDQWTALEVISPARKARPMKRVLADWVRPLQDLLVVSLGRPVSITHLTVLPQGQPAGAPLLDVACQLVQRPPVTSPRAIDVGGYSSPALLTYRDSPVPFSELVPAWFELRERLRDVITDVCGPFYAPFIYSGHRYASTFQSAEAFAHSLFGTRQKKPKQHRERVEAVTKALEAAHLDEGNHEWAEAVLQSRNDKPLRELIEELITAADIMGTQLLQAAPGLAAEAATARAGVSHPGTRGPGIVRRYWLGEAILWLVRASVLAQLGIPMKDLAAKATQKASFINVVNWLKVDDSSPRTSTPGYRHGSCPVNHRTKATMARCKNE